MKTRKIKAFLAPFMVTTMLFGSYSPYSVQAHDELIGDP